MDLATFESHRDFLVALFTENDAYWDALYAVLSGSSTISLRMIEYTVSKYVTLKNSWYDVNGVRFNLRMSSRQQLDAHKKRYFDPFKRINTRLPNNGIFSLTREDQSSSSSLTSSIAQLSFFKWIIENDVLRFIEARYQDIQTQMQAFNRECREQRKENNKTRKRKKSATLTATAPPPPPKRKLAPNFLDHSCHAVQIHRCIIFKFADE
jgi:hypothetical protein